jgi:hypothetical protein
MAGLRTGKLPATHDDRDLRFATYVDLGTVLPKVPQSFGHEKAVPEWGMLGNGPDPEMGPAFDGAGDCVFAGAAHETMLWTSVSGNGEATFSTHGVLADYGAVTGYTPSDPGSDRGTNVRDALGYRRSTGVVDAHGSRHKLGAYVALEPGNLDHVCAAMYLFGAVGIGIRFPETAMDQFHAGRPWDVVAGATIDGGHYIPLVARRSGRLDCVTWAKVQPMTTAFFEAYCDEAYALLSTELISSSGTSPEGFDLAELQADLQAL